MTAFWTDVYQRHFQKYFNKPFDIQIYHGGAAATSPPGLETAIEPDSAPLPAAAMAKSDREQEPRSQRGILGPLWFYLCNLGGLGTSGTDRSKAPAPGLDFSLKLAIYDLARQGYRVYASMGLADRLADNEDDNFGEVILFADVPDPVVPALFVNALFFILHEAIPLDSRFAIGFGDAGREFVRRTQKVALYFTRATGPDEKFDKVRRGEAFGRVFQAYFLTPEEDQFLEEYGPDLFEKEFFKERAAVLSMRRKSRV